MEEIDTSNIIGSRTRGKTIDYAKAAEELGEDDDEEDDDDFQDEDAKAKLYKESKLREKVLSDIVSCD